MSEADEFGPGGDRESGPQSEDAIRREHPPHVPAFGASCRCDSCQGRSAAKIDRYEKALREIGLPAHVPQGFDPLDWWRFKACKRGEIARDALGVTAEDLIRDQWEEAVPRV